MEKETINGFVEKVVYRNAENGYTVVNISVEGDDVVCTGYFSDITEGDQIIAEGSFVEHKQYGIQFTVASYEIKEPETSVAMEKYLGSGIIKGVGPALSAKIVKKFGDETFNIIEREPERLAEIKGITEKKAIEIGSQFEEKKEFEERFENLKNEMYLKYKNYVNRDYLDRILNKDIEGVFKEASEIEKEYETTMYRLSQINAERNVVESTSGKLTEIVEELEELKQEREKLLSYNDTIEIAKEVLKESYDELKNNVGPEFDKKLSYIVEKITNNKYNDVYIDNEHNIKIKTEHGEYVNLERFSTGTIEQVNLALRLAYIDTISKEKLPIILDEAFAFYDDERLANIMKFLNKEYEDRQVIIFTCSNREKKIIDEENILANIVLI